MKRARSLTGAQACSQHVPRARFAVHADLSISLLASERLEPDSKYSDLIGTQLPEVDCLDPNHYVSNRAEICK